MKARSKSDYKQSFKSLKDIFNFGKHKGKTIEDVISSDPGYILWAHDEKVAKFSDEILEYADESDIGSRDFSYPDPYDMYYLNDDPPY